MSHLQNVAGSEMRPGSLPTPTNAEPGLHLPALIPAAQGSVRVSQPEGLRRSRAPRLAWCSCPNALHSRQLPWWIARPRTRRPPRSFHSSSPASHQGLQPPRFRLPGYVNTASEPEPVSLCKHISPVLSQLATRAPVLGKPPLAGGVARPGPAPWAQPRSSPPCSGTHQGWEDQPRALAPREPGERKPRGRSSYRAWGWEPTRRRRRRSWSRKPQCAFLAVAARSLLYSQTGS